MIIITQALLDLLPEWILAKWKDGEIIDLVKVCNENKKVREFLNEHPPHHPNG